jgi:cytochrome c oxidase cbb3-type subunit 3
MTEYRLEMESAAEAVAAYKASLPPEVSIESLVLLEDAESLSSGKELYIKNCAQCHGQNGEGGIGPNMTDNYWIYGPEFSQVITIIQNGVISKGMTPWKGILRPPGNATNSQLCADFTREQSPQCQSPARGFIRIAGVISAQRS